MSTGEGGRGEGIRRRALLAAAGVALTGAVRTALTEGVDAVLAATDDAGLLATLASLEDTAVYVYTAAGPQLSRAPLPGYAQAFLTHHAAHRDALLTTLRGMHATAPPTGRPHPDALPTANTEAAMVAALLAVEGRLLGAQYAALAALGTATRREQVASIFGVDARHATVWRAAAGRPPVPVSFEQGS